MHFPISSAALNAQASLVRPAVISIESLATKCHNGFNSTMAQADVWIQDHNNLYLRYREKWQTWEECCQDVYGVSRQAIHKRVLKIGEHVSSTAVDRPPENQAKTQTFEQIAKLPDPTVPEPPAPKNADQWEKKEHFTAPNPRAEAKPRATPTNNGKPKWALPIWKEVKEDLIGRAINRVGSIHAVCPNNKQRQRVIDALNEAFDALTDWNEACRHA